MSKLSFENFYTQAKAKAEEALSIVQKDDIKKHELNQNAVEYMNKSMLSADKNLFEYVAVLDEEKKKLLDANNQAIKFSLQSFTKNIINHPEITLKEYYLIPEIIDKTELLIYVSKNGDQKKKILCFAENGKYYKVAIKTTGNKEENFLLSFHSVNRNAIERDKKKKGIKIVYDNLTQKIDSL